MSVREPAVKGQFYPSSSNEIISTIKAYNSKDSKDKSLNTRAVIVPHAGYIYSGFTANKALRLLQNVEIERVVVIGPSHRVAFKGTSAAMFDSYDTPLGAFTIDKTLYHRHTMNTAQKYKCHLSNTINLMSPSLNLCMEKKILQHWQK
jgi:AmmeMemoRadiSam system protein B